MGLAAHLDLRNAVVRGAALASIPRRADHHNLLTGAYVD
jgi:hypothetical protein